MYMLNLWEPKKFCYVKCTVNEKMNLKSKSNASSFCITVLLHKLKYCNVNFFHYRAGLQEITAALQYITAATYSRIYKTNSVTWMEVG